MLDVRGGGGVVIVVASLFGLEAAVGDIGDGGGRGANGAFNQNPLGFGDDQGGFGGAFAGFLLRRKQELGDSPQRNTNNGENKKENVIHFCNFATSGGLNPVSPPHAGLGAGSGAGRGFNPRPAQTGSGFRSLRAFQP